MTCATWITCVGVCNAYTRKLVPCICTSLKPSTATFGNSREVADRYSMMPSARHICTMMSRRRASALSSSSDSTSAASPPDSDSATRCSCASNKASVSARAVWKITTACTHAASNTTASSAAVSRARSERGMVTAAPARRPALAPAPGNPAHARSESARRRAFYARRGCRPLPRCC